MNRLKQFLFLIMILATHLFSYSQDLVFGIDPILLKAGQIEFAAIGLYVKDKERQKVLIGAPRFKWGITSRWEFNLTVPLVNIKRSVILAPESTLPTFCDPCAIGQEITTRGVGDVITSIKWQPYRYFDKENGEARLLTLLGGIAWPGNLPGTAPLLVESEVVTTGTGFGCPKASILVGASTLLIGEPWGVLASLLVGVERENELGNRPGHFFIYSYGLGRKFGESSFADIFVVL